MIPSAGMAAVMGGGKPPAMEPAGAKELGGLNWLFCLTGKL